MYTNDWDEVHRWKVRKVFSTYGGYHSWRQAYPYHKSIVEWVSPHGFLQPISKFLSYMDFVCDVKLNCTGTVRLTIWKMENAKGQNFYHWFKKSQIQSDVQVAMSTWPRVSKKHSTLIYGVQPSQALYMKGSWMWMAFMDCTHPHYRSHYSFIKHTSLWRTWLQKVAFGLTEETTIFPNSSNID